MLVLAVMMAITLTTIMAVTTRAPHILPYRQSRPRTGCLVRHEGHLLGEGSGEPPGAQKNCQTQGLHVSL